MLNGPRVIGGSRSGCKLFLDCGADAFLSISIFEVWTDLRLLGLREIMAGGGSVTAPVRLAVELLCTLLESNAMWDFLLSKNDSSAGESLGDSYTLGMAGTGGTSSSLSAELEL